MTADRIWKHPGPSNLEGWAEGLPINWSCFENRQGEDQFKNDIMPSSSVAEGAPVESDSSSEEFLANYFYVVDQWPWTGHYLPCRVEPDERH